jgi:hypothetical protein
MQLQFSLPRQNAATVLLFGGFFLIAAFGVNVLCADSEEACESLPSEIHLIKGTLFTIKQCYNFQYYY